MKNLICAASALILFAGLHASASYAQPEGNGNIVIAGGYQPEGYDTLIGGGYQPEGYDTLIGGTYAQPEGNGNIVVGGSLCAAVKRVKAIPAGTVLRNPRGEVLAVCR